MDKVLVTGAAGFIGGHLVRRLLQTGYDVIALDIMKNPDLHDVEWAIGDITDKDFVTKSLSNVRYLFHVAGLVTAVSVPDSLFWDVHVKGTQNLLQASKKSGVEHFIYCCSDSVVGKIGKKIADEKTTCNPENIYSKTKLQGERISLEFCKEKGLKVTVIRPTWTYGPHDKRTLKVFRMIKKRKFVMIGKGLVNIHPLYIDNLMDAFLLTINNEKAVGEVFIIGDEKYQNLIDFLKSIAVALDVEFKPFSLPLPLAYAAAILGEIIFYPTGKTPPLHRRRLSFFTSERKYDINKSREILGYIPRITTEQGISKTVNWYLEHGYLD